MGQAEWPEIAYICILQRCLVSGCRACMFGLRAVRPSSLAGVPAWNRYLFSFRDQIIFRKRQPPGPASSTVHRPVTVRWLHPGLPLRRHYCTHTPGRQKGALGYLFSAFIPKPTFGISAGSLWVLKIPKVGFCELVKQPGNDDLFRRCEKGKDQNLTRTIN